MLLGMAAIVLPRSSVTGYGLDAVCLILLLLQLPAVAILLSRLMRGPFRCPPLQPVAAQPDWMGKVSVLVPTLNEAGRIAPCLGGLSRQGYEVREIWVIDSHSQDGTPDLVKAAQQQDPRFRLMTDDPLPAGWVGRPWALHNGFLASSEDSEWILGIDADTQPQPGLVTSLLQTAETDGYDLISLSPRFILTGAGELWLQPSLLITLLYRFGAAGETVQTPERMMANGQCFFCRRALLAQMGGYRLAGQSFCDDVTLARQMAAVGAKVGFLDGSQLLKVRMYEGAAETWREWGRSLDLKDAASQAQIWGDALFLMMVQGLPLVLTVVLLMVLASGTVSLTIWLLLGLNLILLGVRVGLNFAIAASYDFSQTRFPWIFWLSPLTDPAAVWRIFLSSMQRPKQWRGRSY
jgi:dolichol-phosphate mannosyltransferase